MEHGQAPKNSELFVILAIKACLPFFRVIMGSYEQFLSTSCVTHMSFLNEIETGRPDSLQPEVQTYGNLISIDFNQLILLIPFPGSPFRHKFKTIFCPKSEIFY